MTPLVLKKNGFRLFFYSNEGIEPVHIHVEKKGCLSKLWIQPVRLAKNEGFKAHEINSIIKIIFENQISIEEKWNEHFNG